MKQVLLVDKDKLFRQILALVLRWRTDLKENIEALKPQTRPRDHRRRSS